MSSTIFVPVYQGRGLWAVKEVERSTGQSLGIVLDDIETQGSAECWAKEYNEIEGDE
jgi:hypothetical protein